MNLMPLVIAIAFGYWFSASLVPLIGGLTMWRSAPLPNHWPAPTIRAVAAFVLKPVVTTAIYIPILLILNPNADNWLVPALALTVLGPGVTYWLLSRFHNGFDALPLPGLILLLVLDATRWISSYLNAVELGYVFGSGSDPAGLSIPLAVVMPTLVTIAAWLLLVFGRPTADPARKRDRYHLGPALLGTIAIVAALVLSSGYAITTRGAALPGASVRVFSNYPIDVLSWNPDGGRPAVDR